MLLVCREPAWSSDVQTLTSEAAVLEAMGMERLADRIDLEAARRLYDEAQALASVESERRPIEAEIRSIEERLVHRGDGIAGYSPAFPAILGVPQLLDYFDDPADTALESAVLLFLEAVKTGLIRVDQYHLAILSEDESVGEESLVQMVLYRETTQELLNAAALASLISDDQIDELRRSPTPGAALAALSKALEERGLGRVRPAVLQIASPRRAGDVVARDVTGRFLSPDGGSVISRTETGFAQGVGRGPWLVVVAMLALVAPLQWMLTRLARRLDPRVASSTPPPWWLGLACAVIGILMAAMIARGVGALRLDPETLAASPFGVLAIAGVSTAFAVLPLAVIAFAMCRVPSYLARVGNVDFMSTVSVGACLGSFLWIAEVAMARQGVASIWLATAAGSASCIVSSAVLGVAIARGLRNDPGWRLALIVAAVSAVAVMAAALRFEPATSSLVAAAGVACVFSAPRLLKPGDREARETAEARTPNTEIASLQSRLRVMPYQAGSLRGSELTRAVDHLLADGNHALRILLVKGRSGTGKSRLLKESAERAAESRSKSGGSVDAFFGDCDDPSSGGAEIPFEPFQQALGAILGVSRMAGPGEAMHRLRSGAAAKGLQAALGTVGMGSLASLLDAGGDEASTRAAGCGEIANAIANVLRHRSARASVILAIDDCQWIDPDSESVLRSLLQQLASSAGSSRIAIALAVRTESGEDGALERQIPRTASVMRVDLDDMLSNDGAELRQGMLAAMGLDPLSRRRLEAELEHRTIENPASIQAFVALAASRGVLEEHGSSLVLQDSADLSGMPPIDDPAVSLQALTGELDPSILEVLRCAAIIGMRFRVSILAEIFRLDVLELLRGLHQAERQGLVVDVLEIDDCFEFADRRVAAAFRAEARRILFASGERAGTPQSVREYHRRFVQVAGAELETRWGGVRDAPYTEVASIAEHALELRDADPASAAKWALAAAGRSLDRGLDGAARRVLEPAFEALQQQRSPGLTAQLRIRIARSLVRAMLGEGGEGELLDRAIAEGDRLVAESIGDAHSTERAEWELLAAEALYRNRRFTEVEQRAVTVSKCSGASRGSTLRAAFLRAASMPMTDIAARNTGLESVRDLLEPALADAPADEASVLLRVKAEVLNTLGFGRLRGESAKSAEDALACFEEALAINRGESAPDRRGARISLGGRGDALQRLGRTEEAERCYTDNLEESREDGDLAGVTRMTSILSSFALGRVESETSTDREADLAAAETLLVESLQSADLQQSPDGMAFALAGLLRHARLAGQDPSAILARIADRRSQLESCRSFSREALEKAMAASAPP